MEIGSREVEGIRLEEKWASRRSRGEKKVREGKQGDMRGNHKRGLGEMRGELGK